MFRNSRFWWWLACGVAVWAGVGLARTEPLTATDVDQPRLTAAAPLPRAEAVVGQTFTAAHNGLSAVEVLGVVYGDPWITNTLRLRLTDSQGHEIGAREFQGFQHNTPLRLTFAPQAGSAGQVYILAITGTATTNATVWAYPLDGYAGGTQELAGQPAAGDLHFTTFYTLLWVDAFREAGAALVQGVVLLPAVWMLLFAPGLLLLGWLFPPARWSFSAGTRAGLALAISVSSLAGTWIWWSTLGGRWSPAGLLVVYGLLGTVALLQTLRSLSWSWRTLRSAAWLGLILVTLLLRWLAIRDQVYPLWVDAPHHLTIAQVLAATGRIPQTYAPILPVNRFVYHFGYHALLVSARWLTDLPWPALMLQLGQVLQALVPLAVYAMVELLTHRPRAAWLGAFFVGLISYFPAYYVSWGRYTQLTGILILAPLLGATWQVLRPAPSTSQSQGRWTDGYGLGLLIAGLAFVHDRLLVFYLTWVLVAVAAGGRQGWKRILVAGSLGLLLASPWIIQLARQSLPTFLAEPQRLAASGGYNDFPWDYFAGDLERGWMLAAAAALAWGLLRRERLLYALAGWVALTTALINIGSGTWLVNNNAWAITLFLPGAVLLGWGGEAWWAAAASPAMPFWRRAIGGVLQAALVGVVAYAGWRGGYLQAGIINPATIQTTPDDAEALDWVARHVPADAVFVVNNWLWLNNIWAVPDGGAWLWPAGGRHTTLPPIDYNYQPDWAPQVRDLNRRLSQVTDANAPETLALWQEAGATHVYIGAKGGWLRPEMLANSPHYELLYSNGAAWVYRIVRP